MKKNSIKNPTLKIQFPNLLLMPVLSLFCSIIKLFGGTEYDWITVILIAPISIYFMWCVGYCVLALIGMIILQRYKN